VSTLVVAKKEFRDGIRSRSLLVLVVVFVVFMVGAAYFFTVIVPSPSLETSGDPRTAAVLYSLFVPTAFLLPIVGTMVGYTAIVSERESGSLKFLLGLPHTRLDVVVGKLLGRSGIVTVAVLIGFAVGGVALYALTSAFSIVDFAIFTGMTIVLGIVFVSIAIAFSTGVHSSTVAIAGAITLALLFTVLWNVVILVIRLAAREFSLIDASAQSSPDWLAFLTYLNPTRAFGGALQVLLPTFLPSNGIGSLGVGANPPFYLEEWFGFVILAFWLVVPLGLAYLHFRSTDL
jgi:ABC-2 type transport system permease protein